MDDQHKRCGSNERDRYQVFERVVADFLIQVRCDCERTCRTQQQRVAIARALAVNPQAILFDEPTSALDPKMADEVMGVITDLARQGLTMIVVTHAMSFARQVASEVIVMAEGRVAEAGPPSQVFGEPKAEVTRDFLKRVEH